MTYSIAARCALVRSAAATIKGNNKQIKARIRMDILLSQHDSEMMRRGV